MNNNYIAIMAGGVGSRFWPSSTEDKPKQFLDILGIGKSLLRITFDRCIKIVDAQNVLVVTNERYKDLVKQHLPEILDKNIITEPSRNNTAPCVALTALHIQAENPDAVFAVLPSDHVIEKTEAYLAKLTEAFEFARNNEAIVTLGIQPTRPDTGYGYIELGNKNEGIYKVESFREKPNHETAEQYLASGNYLWNAGMFIWSVKTILNSFEKNEPSILSVLQQSVDKFGTEDQQKYINEVYPQTKSISVDYAILEKAENVFTIPADIGWSDLGTWSSLHAFLDKDVNNNVVQANISQIDEVKDSLIVAQNERIIVIKGLENYIVVDEPGALLIYPKDQEQEIKGVVKKLMS